MKRWLKKTLFGLHIAIRNMFIHPWRTLLISIGFLGIAMTLLLATSLTDIFHSYFYGNLVATYQDIDLKIHVNKASDTRFFSITPLNNETIETMTDHMYPFFEFDVLVHVSEQDQGYVHLYASSLNDLTAIVGQDQINSSTIADNEVIITQSYADHHELVMGDSLTLTANNTTKVFVVIEIIADQQLFTDDSIFIDKEASLHFFLNALDPNLANLPSILLKNFYNVIYVDISDVTQFDDAVSAFKAQSGFENLTYDQTINPIQVNDRVNRNTALFSGLLSFIIVSILLILYSTLHVVLHDRRKQMTLIHTLGGRHEYTYFIISAELVLEFVVAFIAAIFMTNLMITFGMNYLSSPIIYQLSIHRIFIAFMMMVIIVIGLFVYTNYHNHQQSDMSRMRDQQYLKENASKKQCIIMIILLIIYALLYLPFLQAMFGYYLSVIRIILSVLWMFMAAPLILTIITVIFKRYQRYKKGYYHIKMLQGKKEFYHYLYVSLIVSLVMFLFVFMLQHLDQRTTTIANEYQIDFIVTQVADESSAMDEDIATMNHVKHVTPANIYESVNVEDQVLTYVMAMDQDAFHIFLNIEHLEEAVNELSKETHLAILLPKSYEELYGYEKGESIDLTLNPDVGVQSFVIADFIEKQGMTLALTNEYMIDEQARKQASHLLVKANEERTLVYQALLDAYSDQLVIIYDMQTDYIAPLVFQMIRIKNFMIGYLVVLMLCFVLALSNHQTMLRIDREMDDARLFALGYHRKMMQKTTWYEGIVIVGVILLTSTVAYMLISPQIKGLFVAFGAYEFIQFKPVSIIIGMGINGLMLLSLWMMRALQLPKKQLIHQLKSY